jgi:uncharacterized membrane protein HdeD (DUF308 family)
MSDQISVHMNPAAWKIVAWRGVCTLAFGVLAIGWPGLTLASLMLVFAVYLLLDGAFAIGHAVQAARRREICVALAAEGVVDLTAATIILTRPQLTIVAALTIMGFWALLSGAALLIASTRFGAGALLMTAAALASLLLGALLLFAPLQSAWLTMIWIGIYALVFGSVLLSLAWRIRRRSPAARTL